MNKIFKIIALIIKSWASKSPKRYKWTTNICGILSLIAVILAFTPLGLPTWIVTLSTYLYPVLILISGGSGMKTVDKDLKEHQNGILNLVKKAFTNKNK